MWTWDCWPVARGGGGGGGCCCCGGGAGFYEELDERRTGDDAQYAERFLSNHGGGSMKLLLGTTVQPMSGTVQPICSLRTHFEDPVRGR